MIFHDFILELILDYFFGGRNFLARYIYKTFSKSKTKTYDFILRIMNQACPESENKT